MRSALIEFASDDSIPSICYRRHPHPTTAWKLINQAVLLGIDTFLETAAKFVHQRHRSQRIGNWRIKKHAVSEFWYCGGIVGPYPIRSPAAYWLL